MNNQEKSDHYVYVLVDTSGVYRYIGIGRQLRYKRTQFRTKEYMEVLNNRGTFKFLHENLTKQQVYMLESEYLTKHLNNKSEQWDLVNKMTNRGQIYTLTFDYLDKFLYIDHSSPTHLRWKINSGECEIAKTAVTVVKDGQAGWLNKTGYGGCQILKKTISIHRILWVLANKRDLDWNIVVNHKDSNPYNNHPDNLELATFSDNSKKKKKQHNNSTGITGISFCTTNKNYVAHIYIDGKRVDRSFGTIKRGVDAALKLAIEWRLEMEKIHYTDASTKALNE